MVLLMVALSWPVMDSDLRFLLIYLLHTIILSFIFVRMFFTGETGAMISTYRDGLALIFPQLPRCTSSFFWSHPIFSPGLHAGGRLRPELHRGLGC